MKLASAQINAQVGKIDSNLQAHYRMIELAAKNEADLIVFPEMSITGYCREEAEYLSFTKGDSRLSILKDYAKKNNIIIIAGAPIKINSDLFIGSFVIHPSVNEEIYTKQYLHTGEELFFEHSFDYNPVIEIEDKKIILAICADIDHEEHASCAKTDGATIYIPSIFFSENGIDDGHQKLQRYAEKFEMNILMSNFCGELWNTKSGGRSAFWNSNGEKLMELSPKKEGILLVEQTMNKWTIKSIE